MAIYDNNGTASSEIGKLYDNDGTANFQLGKVYDNNGTTNSLTYELIEQLSVIPTASNYTWTAFRQGTGRNPPTASIGSGLSMSAMNPDSNGIQGYYTAVDTTIFSKMTITASGEGINAHRSCTFRVGLTGTKPVTNGEDDSVITTGVTGWNFYRHEDDEKSASCSNLTVDISGYNGTNYIVIALTANTSSTAQANMSVTKFLFHN